MRALSEAYLDAVPSSFTFMHCLTFHRFVAALAVLSRRELSRRELSRRELSRHEHAATREPNAERLVEDPRSHNPKAGPQAAVVPESGLCVPRDDLRDELERVVLLIHSGVLGVVYADVHKTTVFRTGTRPANLTRRLLLLAKILDPAREPSGTATS